ncbi:MAG: pyridoxal 5'-phosphate synthase glutaminase subunit PdxT [Candidatus Baldrarchaeia archaeon]
MKFGVIALQGDVREHIEMLEIAMDELGIEGEVVKVKKPEDLENVKGIIIPGGESTIIGRLCEKFGLLNKIRDLVVRNELAVMGTCAGLVLLAKKIVDARVGEVSQPLLGLMDISVVRNAFGRQRESFEVDLEIPEIGSSPFRAIFIRAPIVKDILNDSVKVLAKFSGKIVAVRQKNMLALSFHPELTNDTRVHKYFLNIATGKA